MPEFKVFVNDVKWVSEPIEVGVFDAKDEDDAIFKAGVEFGMHESRYLNVFNILPEMVAKKLENLI